MKYKKIGINKRFLSTNNARLSLLEGNLDSAYALLQNAFDAEPKAWWLAMELIRAKIKCLTKNTTSSSKSKYNKHIIFSPDYTAGNSYQFNIYSTSEDFGYLIHPESELPIEKIASLISAGYKVIYHQHWVKEIYWTARSLEEGIARIDRITSLMRAYQSFGVKVVWTLHNLLDHDSSDLQEYLCRYAHSQMSSIVDRIYVHTRESVKLLSNQCGQDLGQKCYLLEHPLYDEMLSFEKNDETGLLKDIHPDTPIILCLGMIRPYKGVPDLLDAFSLFCIENPEAKVMLIIAGSLQDPEVRICLDKLDPKVAKFVKLIPRRILNSEIATLMSRATVAVLPYRNILISGSYYLATTFGKPVIAPARGMFTEKIEHNKTGILYDGSVTGLAKAITYALSMPKSTLSQLGLNAKEAASNLTIRSISMKYFITLKDFNHA